MRKLIKKVELKEDNDIFCRYVDLKITLDVLIVLDVKNFEENLGLTYHHVKILYSKLHPLMNNKVDDIDSN